MARFTTDSAVIAIALRAANPTNADLVTLYNANTAGNPVNKFASKEKAIVRSASALMAAAVAGGMVVDTETFTLCGAPAPEAPAPRAGKKKAIKYNVAGTVEIVLPREGSARRAAFDMVAREEGATEEEIAEATGWTGRNLYCGIRLLAVGNGYSLRQSDDGRIHLAGE